MASNPPQRNGMGEDEACSFAMAAATGSVPPMVLTAVVQLDVLEIIKRAGPGAHLSPSEIAAQLPTKNPNAASMLDRMLRLLASYEILSYSVRTLVDGRVERLYGLTPACRFLTRNEDGPTLEAMCVLTQSKVIMGSWYYLKDAVLDGGIAMEKALGANIHEYQGIDQRFNELFNNTMADYSDFVVKKMLENYEGFEGLSTLVDVAGGTGKTLQMITSKYPKLKGINFDLPHVIKDAPAYEGVEHIGGDMFVSIPEGDAIFMKWVIGDWSDDLCLKFLKNCYDALPIHGKVIICEYMLPEVPETSYAAKTVFHVDVIRMANYVGGKERTEPEFKALAKQAGFKGFKVACSAYDFKVIEYLKSN